MISNDVAYKFQDRKLYDFFLEQCRRFRHVNLMISLSHIQRLENAAWRLMPDYYCRSTDKVVRVNILYDNRNVVAHHNRIHNHYRQKTAQQKQLKTPTLNNNLPPHISQEPHMSEYTAEAHEKDLRNDKSNPYLEFAITSILQLPVSSRH